MRGLGFDEPEIFYLVWMATTTIWSSRALARIVECRTHLFAHFERLTISVWAASVELGSNSLGWGIWVQIGTKLELVRRGKVQWERCIRFGIFWWYYEIWHHRGSRHPLRIHPCGNCSDHGKRCCCWREASVQVQGPEQIFETPSVSNVIDRCRCFLQASLSEICTQDYHRNLTSSNWFSMIHMLDSYVRLWVHKIFHCCTQICKGSLLCCTQISIPLYDFLSCAHICIEV